MPNLPPPVWAELFYSNAWNTITDDVRVATSAVTITRGLSSESASDAEPTTCACDLDSRDDRYGPRNPTSPLYGLIGRNTPMRLGYTAGSPWAALAGGLGGTDAIETPEAAALHVTGDFDLRIDIALDDYTEDQMLACRYYTTGNNRCWALEIIDGLLEFMWSPDGTLASRLDVTSTETLKAYNGQRLAVRVTLDVNNGAGGHEVRFYTGRTVNDTEWNLLGDPVAGSASITSIYAGTSAPLEFGCGTEFNQTPAGGTLNTLRGKAYALRLLNGIAGTAVVAMAVSAAAVGGTSFVDSTGLTWTKQGAAAFTNKHIRMSGEVPAWPPTRDLSLKDNYVSVTPAGVLRRMDAGNKPTDSALLRYIKAHDPIECWPLTDGKQTNAQGGASLLGGSDMTYQLTLGTVNPEWQGGKLADWLEDVITFKAETAGIIKGRVPNSTSAAAAWSVDVFLAGGGQGAAGTLEINDRGAYTDADNRIRFQVSMDAYTDSISVYRGSLGETSSSSSLIASISSAGIFNDGLPHHIRLTVDPGATDSTFAVYLDGVSRASGTVSGIVVKAVRDVAVSWSLVSGGGVGTADQQLGFVTYWDGTGPTAAQMYNAYTGFQGEKAGDRIVRLAAESGYTASVAGESTFQRRLGIQGSKKLLALMNEASATNFGYLLDARDRAEVIHRGQSTLWNQPPGLTLDFSAGLISPPFKPVDDDKLTENDVSVQREFGSVPARVVQESGDLNVQDPEDGGVGRYDQAYTYSLQTDAQAWQVAGMRVHLGTYAGVRYTRITLNLANTRVYALIDDILRLDVGDKIRLTTLPADHGPDAVDVLIAGYTESAGPDAWTITFNCVPGEPWTAAVTDSATYGRADTGGCRLAEALDTTETGVDVFTTGLSLWVDSPTYPSDFPFDVRTGGEVMRVTACDSAVRDTFTRSVTDGWGTPTVGGAWTNSSGSATDYDVTGSAGTHTLTNVDVARVSTTGTSGTDHDVRVDIATGALATGGPQYCSVVARHTDVNNMYFAQIEFGTSAAVTLTLRKRVAGTETTLATLASGSTGLTHVAGTFFRIRLQAIGSTIRMKAWLATDPEPVAWTLSATDSALTSGSNVGVRSVRQNANTNANLVVSFDNFVLLNPQTFTVTRSLNGVVKSHPSGQDIRLANPVYAGL
ncbi:hypothetical protein [Streptomyces cylindrosporus]|uniref:Uncharacterized protein n=1 Tax=Streptomyces cylindrosporus TaxID=2927583 RepID=A0ABS9Y4J4_9ACTN|nr:hypothetical protein [Streptomyces cylindrosporus]MCI3272152.1 hypothetical protein [Streptomyces cylindrosporus]